MLWRVLAENRQARQVLPLLLVATLLGMLAPAAPAAPASASSVSVFPRARTVIARTGQESLPKNGGALLYFPIFSLARAGRALLAHAPSHQLGAQVTLRDSTATTSTNIALVAFS